MAPRTINSRLSAAIAAALFAVVAIVYWTWHSGEGKPGQGGGAYAGTPNAAPQSPDSVDLSDSQLDAVKVAPVEARDFPVEKNAIGSIDFDEEMAVQVFAPYEGRIIALFGSVGDDVKKGQTLFTIDSPDLLQAEFDLDFRRRGSGSRHQKPPTPARPLYDARGFRSTMSSRRPPTSRPPKAICARRAMRCVCSARPTPRSTASSPIAAPTRRSSCRARSPAGSRRAMRRRGCSCNPAMRRRRIRWPTSTPCGCWRMSPRMTARPFASVSRCRSRSTPFPARCSTARSTTIGASVDPNTRRVLVRSEFKDPQHQLRSGMFANFVISVGAPMRSPAIPIDGVVREGDGTMTIWVTADRRRFTRRTVKIGEAARRLSANPRGRASRRTGRHRRRAVPEQCARYGVALRLSLRAVTLPDSGLRI